MIRIPDSNFLLYVLGRNHPHIRTVHFQFPISKIFQILNLLYLVHPPSYLKCLVLPNFTYWIFMLVSVYVPRPLSFQYHIASVLDRVMTSQSFSYTWWSLNLMLQWKTRFENISLKKNIRLYNFIKCFLGQNEHLEHGFQQ